MLIKINWPNDSKRRVKLKRYLFGDKWKQRVRASNAYITRYFAPRFTVERVRRGVIWVPDEEVDSLIRFLESIGVDYIVMKNHYLYAGPKILIKLGVNAINNHYFKALVDDLAVKRAKGKIPCLEDALVLTLSKALRDNTGWISYVVMGLLIRSLDIDYMLYRAMREGILTEFSDFLSSVFSVLSGEIADLEEVFHAVPLYREIMACFNSLHPYASKYINGRVFPNLPPKTIASLASKQLFGY